MQCLNISSRVWGFLFSLLDVHDTRRKWMVIATLSVRMSSTAVATKAVQWSNQNMPLCLPAAILLTESSDRTMPLNLETWIHTSTGRQNAPSRKHKFRHHITTIPVELMNIPMLWISETSSWENTCFKKNLITTICTHYSPSDHLLSARRSFYFPTPLHSSAG